MEGKRNGQNTHGIDKGIDKCTGEKEQRQQSLALPRVLIGADLRPFAGIKATKAASGFF